jgi:hypothetical protein
MRTAPPSAQPSPGVVSPARQHVPGEVIVQFRAGATHERIHEIIIATGSKIKNDLGALTYLVSFSNERPMDELIASLRVYPEVLHAEPNWITRVEPPRPLPGSKPVPFGK